MIYLSSVYSVNPNNLTGKAYSDLMEKRYRYVMKRAAEFIKEGHYIMSPILHGHEVPNLSRTVNPARGLFLRTNTFAACSHCHSTSSHTAKTVNGELLTTWSFGCLCDLNPDYAVYGNNWNWGFGLIEIRDKGDFEVQNLRILPNGKVR